MRHALPVLVILALTAPGLASGILLPNFDDIPIIEGLAEPVAVRFDAGGGIFVAEKAGRVKLFDPLPTPGPGLVVLDIRDQVMDFQDRGLLGLALHPQYPAVPYVFVLFTYDAPPGGVAPVWNDHCDAPNEIGGGCVVSGRLVRYTMVSTASGPQLVDPHILIQDEWYQQYPSHSIGDLAFGPDGMLYISGGEGASYQFVDVGAAGTINQSFPSAGDPLDDGGALRAQDLLTGGDALGTSGSILRVDPETGAAAPGNPIAGVRQIAFGLRNPFRIGFRPGSHELWIGDVGESSWEEIDRIADVGDPAIENFGWPCYEGAGPHPGYKTKLGCSALVNDQLPPGAPGTKTPPFFSYAHGLAPGYNLPSGCQNGNSQAVSGIAFYAGGTYPDQYQHALFFADYAVNCIYAMRAGADGIPDPSQVDVIERAAETPVSLTAGPGGDIYYTSVSGSVRRITYRSALTAKATANTTSGEPPLTVVFDGSGSFDPAAGGPLDYAWDLDGDGGFDDATGPHPQRTYAPGIYPVRLQVSHNGATAVSPPLVITVGERPVATITAPAEGAPWKAGQRISFSGTASDPQDGPLAAQAMSWRILLLHCPQGGCHQHPFESFEGVAGGSFVTAPDGYPAYYDIELTVTDASGFTTRSTVRIDAIGTELTFKTTPPGLPLLYTGVPTATPARVTEVAGDKVMVEAGSPGEYDGSSYVFTGWSDGGDRAHVVTVPDQPHGYVARYEIDRDRDGMADSSDPCPANPDPECTMGNSPSGGSCAAGGSSPGVAPFTALALVLLRCFRRRTRCTKL